MGDGPMEPMRRRAAGRRSRSAVTVTSLGTVLVLALAGAVLMTSCADRAAAPTNDSTTAPSSDTSGAIDASALEPGKILLEPIDVPTVDAFTESVATSTERPLAVELPELPVPTTTDTLPAGKVALAQVSGGEPGLYGGTRSMSSCDADQLASFLGANPEKADAWAKVQGIEPAEIESYIKDLTPLTLTRDTRLTNHGFADGKAVAHQSVLQAGHSVFVDVKGVPRAKCSCGNPLAPPEPVSGTPSYVGTPWSGFSTSRIVVVVETAPLDDGFTVVDLDTGELVQVALGSGTVLEQQADETAEPTSETTEPTSETTDGTIEAVEVELLSVGNILAVTPGAVGASFTVAEDTVITSIENYHYGPETPPGQIGLVAGDGTMVGPWQAVGREGQGGVANAYWTVTPNVVVGPGTYTVWDSEPSTWSTNGDAGGYGFTVVIGVAGTGDGG